MALLLPKKYHLQMNNDFVAAALPILRVSYALVLEFFMGSAIIKGLLRK